MRYADFLPAGEQSCNRTGVTTKTGVELNPITYTCFHRPWSPHSLMSATTNMNQFVEKKFHQCLPPLRYSPYTHMCMIPRLSLHSFLLSSDCTCTAVRKLAGFLFGCELRPNKKHTRSCRVTDHCRSRNKQLATRRENFNDFHRSSLLYEENGLKKARIAPTCLRTRALIQQEQKAMSFNRRQPPHRETAPYKG